MQSDGFIDLLMQDCEYIFANIFYTLWPHLNIKLQVKSLVLMLRPYSHEFKLFTVS